MNVYSSWNTFLQKNIEKYDSQGYGQEDEEYDGYGEHPSLKSTSQNDIHQFNNDVVNSFTDNLANLNLLSPPVYTKDNYLHLFGKYLSVDDWSKFNPTKLSSNDESNEKSNEKSNDKSNTNKITYLKSDNSHVKFLKLSQSSIEHINFDNVLCLDWTHLAWNEKLVSFSSDDVKHINSFFSYDNPNFETFRCRQLKHANCISLSNCPSLAHVFLPELERLKVLNISNSKLTKKAYIEFGPSLGNNQEIFNLDKLCYVKTFRFYNNSKVDSSKHANFELDLPNLKCAKTIVIENNDDLKTIKLSKLEHVKTLIIKNNKYLKEIHLGKLCSSCKFIVEDCPELIKIDNKELKYVEKFLHVDNCPNLEHFQALDNSDLKVKCAIVVKTKLGYNCKPAKCDSFWLSNNKDPSGKSVKCFNVA